jgi:primary-amine oxidase
MPRPGLTRPDSHSGEVLTIDYPHLNPKDGEAPAPSSEKAHTALASRDRYPPPLEIALDEPNFKVRTDLKPLHVEQPEGVSFALDGRVLSWQKWKLHVGYSYR